MAWVGALDMAGPDDLALVRTKNAMDAPETRRKKTEKEVTRSRGSLRRFGGGGVGCKGGGRIREGVGFGSEGPSLP